MDGFADLRDLIDEPDRTRTKSRSSRSGAYLAKLRAWSGRHWGVFAVVVAPTLLAIAYYFLIASNQYESQADFVVKTAAQANGGGSSGLAQMFGLTSAMNPSASESYSVGDYLSSHDAVDALEHRFDLVAMFHPPGADFLSELHPAHPSAERLLKYYRRQVKVAYSTDTGITTLRVRAFRPQDAQRIVETLLELGEARVNLLNQRALENSVSVAKTQLREAEAGVAASQGGLTHFRQDDRDIDPERTSNAQIQLVTNLQGELAQGRAQLAAMASSVQPDSPQYQALEERVRALQGQVDAQRGQLTGGPKAIAPGLGQFEGLKLKGDFASKRYESAAAALETAREQALKQQLYIVRVVEPNLPQTALYPQRGLRIASIFAGLLLAYGIGWLILAGVREHAA